MASLFRDTKLAYAKTVSVDRTMTTATEIAKIPKNCRIIGFVINGTASDAGTTATLSFGSSTTSNEYVSGASVASGYVNYPNMVDSTALGTVTTTDSSVYAKYAETGTASTVGAWQVTILFTATY